MGNCTQPLNSAPGQQSKQTKKTWAQTLDQVLNQIHNSDKQGSNLMSYEIWKHIFSKFKDFHFTKDEKLQFIQLLKKYFQVNNFQSQIEDEASFCGELGAKFHKLENTLYFKHKEALEYLKFVANKIYHQQKLSQLLFIQLQFDLSEQEVLEVAGKVRVFCSNDMSAFAFLSLYFQISIINKLKNQPLKKVQQIYQGLLKILQKKYPASILENQTLDIKKYFDKINSDHKIEELIFKQNAQSHYDQLKGFVIMKAQSAKNDLHLFETLVKGVCYEKGYGFKSGVKIKNPDHSIAIFRTIEKLVQDKIENPGSTLEHAEDKDFSKHELNALIDEEKKLAHLKVEKIPNSQKSIKFQSKDLLRGKCTFSTIEDLVDTGNLLIAYIKSQGFEIIDLKDRLNKHTKDAVIIIKFPNSIAELQLVLQLDSVSNEFNHKLYQLTRSKLYSPITNLFVQNEKWGQQFFSQQFQLFENLINSKTKIQANKDLAFYDFKKDLNEFRNNYLLPNQIICKKDQSFKLQDKKLVFAEIKHLIDLIKQKAKPKKQQDNRKQTIDYHEVKFFKENFDYKKAFEVLNKFDDKQLSKNRHLLRQKGQILKKQAKLDQSLECFLICQKIEANMPNKSEPQMLDQAITFQNIGTVYYDQGNYQKALDNFEKSLAIKIKIQGNDSLDVAVSLTNIGLVYRSQGNYPKALQNYEKCLEIRTKLQGKDSINVSVTLENIGMAYFSQANYLKALENYQKCLEIRNKLKGKDSIDVAIIFNKIGNVYKNQGKHDKALQYFEKSLEIRIKVKGKESLDVAVAENSIGNVYHEQKNYQKALEHFERSLDLRIKVKGKDSIDVAVALNGIGNVYHEQGNFQKALENYKRCLEIRTKVKGEESIDVAAALESIGTVYNSQGDYEKALQHYERCMQINTKAKGKDCIDNAQTLYNISSTYKQMKKMEEAIESASESYRIRQQILGDNNPKTKSSLSRLQELQNVQCTC